MNAQTLMSMSGSRPGPGSSQIPNRRAQQNRPPSGQNRSVGAGRGPYGGITSRYEEIRTRKFMLDRIYAIFARRNTEPMNDLQKKNIVDVVKLLEGMLFKRARNLEEYVDLTTLEGRLQYLTRLYHMNRIQRQQHINLFSSVGTNMIPATGMSHEGSSRMINMSAIDASVASTRTGTATANPVTASTGSEHFMARQGDFFCTSDGFMSDGIQQSPANFSMASAGNHSSSVVGYRMGSHLIHTPGIIGNNSQSFAGLGPSNNCIFSTVESTLAMQQQHQEQYAGQNSITMHSLSSHTDSGIGSALMHTPYRLSNGGLCGELDLMGNNLQHANSYGTSEGYVGATSYNESAKTSSLQLEHHQRPSIEGDGNGTSSPELSGPRNLVTAPNSVRSIMDTWDSANLQTASKANTTSINNQSNFNFRHQAGHVKPNVEKMSYWPSLTSGERVVQSSQQQCFEQQSQWFEEQHQYQLNKQSQHDQIMLESEALNQTQLGSNFGTQVNSEPSMQNHYVDSQQQVSEQFQIPGNQNQLGCVIDSSRAAPLLSTSINQHTAGSNSGNLQYIQPLNVQRAPLPKSDCSTLPAGEQPEIKMENQTQCEPVLCVQVSQNISHEQHVQEDFHQRISGQDEAQPNRLSSESPTVNQSIVSSSNAQFSNSSDANDRAKNLDCERKNLNQRRWLLFLNHADHCRTPQGECQEPHCIDAQKLLKHMAQCGKVSCSFPRCKATKNLLNHFRNCKNSGCPVCVPVRDLMHKNYLHYMKAHGHPNPENTSARSSADPVSESLEVLQPPFKRLKPGQPHSPVMEEVKPRVSSSYISDICMPQNVQKQDHTYGETSTTMKSKGTEVKFEDSVSAAQENTSAGEMNKDTTHFHNQMSNGESNGLNDHNASVIEENIKVESESNMPMQENVVQPSDNVEIKSGNPKSNGWASLTELFNSDQVREHICSLREWTCQSKSKAEKNQAKGHSINENSCQLCGIEKLAFEPPPIYCANCGIRIKRNATYYTGEARQSQSFCKPCYNGSRGESIVFDGLSILKAKLQKKKNDEETEESWVQCDKCEAWQHQICALFNGKKNDGGQAEYTCANCYLAEFESGERQPLPQSAILGAKDLPKSKLSNHLEERVFRRLKEDRDERARLEGKRVEEVPSAEELVIRVVFSVDKKLEVKPRFLDIFREENYPADFSYKSKVVLLFQRIEGVEVCIFAMYVQEFGSECAFPNQRRVYLSYLDSVRYFRPEVRAASGEALRTFVYHEILIGYLEYCKMRGFTSCYIWACPPLKGDDYILYCHPKIQKTPKSDKLRDWYLSMLTKASRDNIVVELTNLYDHFFVQMGESRAKVTASRLPYFDGDYWPGAAEDLIYKMQQEVDGIQPNGKGSTKKTTKRALKASGLSVLSGNASKDQLLMQKIGDTICPMKEDFIMVHLQHCCKHCCVLMVSGMRWVCQQCKNFQLCDKCYGAEKNRGYRERHPINQKEKHTFLPIQITDVPSDTKDEDEILESEFFDTRQAFLSLCQGNHYQYDTLRRAKHSSMMVLYHLHNPTATAFVPTCKLCHLDIEAGQGWRCEVCPDYDVCNACYQSEGVIKHPHKLTNSPAADRDGQNKEARQLRIQQLRIMLDLLVHVSQCRFRQCQYTNCRKVKVLFHHGSKCKVRLNGGCSLCKKIWHLLRLHARNCKESQCSVPRCQDLKDYMRRLQQQSESRRRAAVDEWSRKRAAEISSNNE